MSKPTYPRNAGDKCGCCNDQVLVEIRGAVVCLHCDNVRNWPKGVSGK